MTFISQQAIYIMTSLILDYYYPDISFVNFYKFLLFPKACWGNTMIFFLMHKNFVNYRLIAHNYQSNARYIVLLEAEPHNIIVIVPLPIVTQSPHMIAPVQSHETGSIGIIGKLGKIYTSLHRKTLTMH